MLLIIQLRFLMSLFLFQLCFQKSRTLSKLREKLEYTDLTDLNSTQPPIYFFKWFTDMANIQRIAHLKMFKIWFQLATPTEMANCSKLSSCNVPNLLAT